MAFIVCTDIFGISSHLKTLLNEISLGPQWQIADPYAGRIQSFANESEAYKAFTEAGGLQHYIDLLQGKLSAESEAVTIIGFSAGAAAAYVAMNQASVGSDCRLFGFYPGQIRHYLTLDNDYSCRLVFPKYERHFELDPVCQVLTTKTNLEQERTPYLHGFMNPQSAGFSAKGYQEYKDQLLAWLNQAS